MSAETDWNRASENPANWGTNTALDALKAAGNTYDQATVSYDDSAVYYDGYDPTGQTPDGSKSADFNRVSNTPSDWDRVPNIP